MRFDDAFANSKYLAGAKDFPPRWAAKAAGFREGMAENARLGLAYGPGERNWFDLYMPTGTPKGIVVFIHGGYWLAFGPRDFSHLAAGAIEAGWACATLSYTLAPQARIGTMTLETATALAAIADQTEGPMVVTGHSAGGHLSARMAQEDMALAPMVLTRLKRVVPISPLSDLRPLLENSMNNDLGMNLSEARAESPALHARRANVSAHVWVGGAERPSFLDQARRLGNAWTCPVTVEPDLHHFNVIDGLESAESSLMQTVLKI
ncbi:MAG: alpha/beta hydrolase [Paracoccaceae bacterium]